MPTVADLQNLINLRRQVFSQDIIQPNDQDFDKQILQMIHDILAGLGGGGGGMSFQRVTYTGNAPYPAGTSPSNTFAVAFNPRLIAMGTPAGQNNIFEDIASLSDQEVISQWDGDMIPIISGPYWASGHFDVGKMANDYYINGVYRPSVDWNRLGEDYVVHCFG